MRSVSKVFAEASRIRYPVFRMPLHSGSILARPERKRLAAQRTARHPVDPPRATRHPPPTERKRLAAPRAARYPAERFGLLGSGRMGLVTEIGLKF